MQRKWIGMTVAAVIVAAAAAALGGYAYGVRVGQARAAEIRATFLVERGLGAFAPGQNGPNGAGSTLPAAGAFNPANLAMGQVKQVDGHIMQLSTATEVLTVRIDDQTQIRRLDQGSLDDLQVGERVTVRGSRDADGSMTAESIQIGGPEMVGPPPVGTPVTPAP